MRLLQFFIILQISMILYSCKERAESDVNKACIDSCVNVSGLITTGQNSREILDKAYYEFGWKKYSVIVDYDRLISNGYSDSKGFYSFSFKPRSEELKNLGNYYLTIKKSQDYFDAIFTNFNIFRLDTTFVFNAHISSKANLIIRFRDFKPIYKEDYFSVTPSVPNYNSNGVTIVLKDNNGKQSNPNFSFSDSSFNIKELKGITAGNQYTYLSILIKKNGIRFDKYDSIYITKGDTGIYEIKY